MSQSINIAFFLLVHEEDDGIFVRHLAHSLTQRQGTSCYLYVAQSDYEYKLEHGYVIAGRKRSLRHNMKSMRQVLTEAPHFDMAICDTPAAVLWAHQYAKNVVYYQTEYYPSKKNLRNTSGLFKPIKALALFIVACLAGCKADALLLGEFYKSRLFAPILPFKRHARIPYFPSAEFFPSFTSIPLIDTFRVFYGGPLTEEKGFLRVLNLMQMLAQRNTKTNFVLHVRSNDAYDYKSILPNLMVEILPELPYSDFCEELSSCHMLIDWRDGTFENSHCLPVKLFHALAAGRPFIYTNLKAIRKEIPDVETCGGLLETDDTEGAILQVEHYMRDTDHYIRHCRQARHLFETKYNWEVLLPSLNSLIDQLL